MKRRKERGKKKIRTESNKLKIGKQQRKINKTKYFLV